MTFQVEELTIAVMADVQMADDPCGHCTKCSSKTGGPSDCTSETTGGTTNDDGMAAADCCGSDTASFDSEVLGQLREMVSAR